MFFNNDTKVSFDLYDIICFRRNKVKYIKATVGVILFVAVTLVLIQVIGVLFGCNIAGTIFSNNSGYENNTQNLVLDGNKDNTGYSSVLTDLGYSELSKEEKALYNLLSQNITNISEDVQDNGYYKINKIVYDYSRLSDVSINKAVLVFINENPDVFWISNTYSYAYEGNKTVLYFNSYVSQGDCSKMSSDLLDVLQKFSNSLPDGLSDYELEKYVFDYITKNCKYDTATSSGNENWKSYTAYGALVDKTAVCEGYSKAALKLLNMCGVDSALVCGYIKGTYSHMWNIVKISGNWYHLDITGCDDDTLVTHKYFNLTDDTIKESHVISDSFSDEKCDSYSNIILPQCNSTEFNYYQKDAYILSGVEEEDINSFSNYVIEMTKSGKNIDIYVADSMNFNDAIDKLFRQNPYFYVKSLRKAQQNSEFTFDTKNITYVVDENTRGITIKNPEKSS